jgi:voltage-gated potassium channel
MLYIGEANLLLTAISLSRRKIIVFLFGVLVLASIFGSVMYLIEGEENGFTSIPRSIYWAIVTITTVGYGDISPQTEIGQTLAAFVMIIGYATIAIPTGIISAEYTAITNYREGNIICSECNSGGHNKDSIYCKDCGSKIITKKELTKKTIN